MQVLDPDRRQGRRVFRSCKRLTPKHSSSYTSLYFLKPLSPWIESATSLSTATTTTTPTITWLCPRRRPKNAPGYPLQLPSRLHQYWNAFVSCDEHNERGVNVHCFYYDPRPRRGFSDVFTARTRLSYRSRGGQGIQGIG